jgi:hypothetical protein
MRSPNMVCAVGDMRCLTTGSAIEGEFYREVIRVGKGYLSGNDTCREMILVGK